MANLFSNLSHHDVGETRQRLSKLLQIHGYSACREALILLQEHYNSSNNYESMEDFITNLNRTIIFETDSDSSVIDPDLAYVITQKLSKSQKCDDNQQVDSENALESENKLPKELTLRIKNVQYDKEDNTLTTSVAKFADNTSNEFNIHYNFLLKKLSALPIFQSDFKLTKLSTLTGSSQQSIKCICFGLLIKNIEKIGDHLLIDSTGRVPVRLTPETTFRNRLVYENCLVIIEGVYINPDDVLFATNVGLPPILLDPIIDKSQACVDEKLVIALRDLHLDDDSVCNALDMLFTGYNCMEDPPLLFILIGDFTTNHCEPQEFQIHMKKLVRILRTCDNLRNSHFVFVPGPKDTDSMNNGTGEMPKHPLTKQHLPINLLQLSKFENIYLATNPAHIFIGDRLITAVAHNYLKVLPNNLIHDLSDHRSEFFETVKKIILSNGHLSAGKSRKYNDSMKIWHRPDLLILADSEAIGNRHDFNLTSQTDTTFTTLPSFSLQSFQFKVYYVKTGEIEDSQVSSEALKEVVEIETIDEDESDRI